MNKPLPQLTDPQWIIAGAVLQIVLPCAAIIAPAFLLAEHLTALWGTSQRAAVNLTMISGLIVWELAIRPFADAAWWAMRPARLADQPARPARTRAFRARLVRR